MRRTFRMLTAFAACAAFLLAQAAAAAYACAGPVADPVAMAQMKAAMDADGGMCDKHCTTGTVSLDVAKPAPSAMPVMAAVALRVIELAPVVDRAAPLRAEARGLAGPAPPLIRFTVLRI